MPHLLRMVTGAIMHKDRDAIFEEAGLPPNPRCRGANESGMGSVGSAAIRLCKFANQCSLCAIRIEVEAIDDLLLQHFLMP